MVSDTGDRDLHSDTGVLEGFCFDGRSLDLVDDVVVVGLGFLVNGVGGDVAFAVLREGGFLLGLLDGLAAFLLEDGFGGALLEEGRGGGGFERGGGDRFGGFVGSGGVRRGVDRPVEVEDRDEGFVIPTLLYFIL